MVTVQTPPTPYTSPSSAPRDAGIDLVRAFCVVVVVVLHALMVGVTIGPAGPIFENAAEGAPWIVPVTWVAQIMPIFFVVGGFAGAVAYRRMRERGGDASHFVAARVRRLLLPAVIGIAAAGGALMTLTLVGIPSELVRVAGFHYGQPLWFLGVFLHCQALLPALHVAHERAPLRSILTLVAAAMVVDGIRAVSGIDAIGLLNLAFVWLALQQLGFFLADGRIDELRRRTRIIALAVSIGALATTMALGLFSPDLLENLNPPTTTLLMLGVAQTMLLSLARRPLAVLSSRPRIAAFAGFVTARTMTIYLWHMPVLLAMAGVTALIGWGLGMPLPEPSTAAWWATRPLWVGAAVAFTVGVAVTLGGVERRRLPGSTSLASTSRASTTVASTSRASTTVAPTSPVSSLRGAAAVVLGIAAIALLCAAGTSVGTAALAVAALAAALGLVMGARPAATAGHGRGSSASQPLAAQPPTAGPPARSVSSRASTVDPATAAGIVMIAPSGTRKHS